ncbi:membrane protein insertion efficiency factor YidD [Sunxiuqinia indica]|uniref:membrane protein insertion efficiency factor YidD n=1 Tax=Sunxiuqinia indica TaxID=2692584 RepID=UPI001F1EC597|nr:membrane protein insertion efficiency factor YidD [Sunxiuqinia indica]
MRDFRKWILKALGWLLLLPVYFYKYAISPFTSASCRHVPTCSQYAVEAIKIHGPFKGFWLTVKRISKCHPWGTHGYDPVPKKDHVKTEKLNLK